MHKDMFDRVIEVGDVVGWSGSGSGVEIAVVTQIMPKTIKINNGGTIYPKYTVVLNEQMIASGKSEKLDKLRDEHKKHFDFKKPVVRNTINPTFRYAVVFVGEIATKKMAVYVAKLPHANNDPTTKPWSEVEKDLKARGFIMHRNGSSYRSYHTLKPAGENWKVSNDYYGPYQDIILRDVKSIGLDVFVDQIIDFDIFTNLVKDKLVSGEKPPRFF